MSSETLARGNFEDPKLLRKLADLVAQCRIETAVQTCSSNGSAEHLSTLSTVLNLFALKFLEQNQLQELLAIPGAAPFKEDVLPSAGSALQAQLKRFAPGAQRVELPLPHAPALMSNWSRLASPELEPLWSNPCLIGYVYQYFFLDERKQSQRHIQTANKELSVAQIIAFTQLYTPLWVANYLLENTLAPALPGRKVPEPDRQSISVLDPACGCGHFLVPAFDMLFKHAVGRGAQLEQAAQLALERLYGADIDATALAALALTMLLKYAQATRVFPCAPWENLACVEDRLLGSLDRAFAPEHILGRKYSAVVTNPPYVGRKLMSRQLKLALKQEYPDAYSDLCAPFVVRGLELLQKNGRLGLITQSSILSLPSYSEIRRKLISQSRLLSSVELGSGVFPLQGGEKVSSVLIVAQTGPPGPQSDVTTFFDLTASADKATDLRLVSAAPQSFIERKVFVRHSSMFLRLPNVPFHYRAPSFLFELLTSCPTLTSVADIRQGLATTDNDRFVKYWWEVEPDQIGKIWFPYVKGAGTARWSSPILHVVNFWDNGREIKKAVTDKYPYLFGKSAWVVKNEQYYFRSGLCFSFVSTEQFAVRVLPAGCIFDVAASAIFVPEEEKYFLLGYLNSTLMRALSKLYNPTINVQVGDVKRLPLFAFQQSVKDRIAQAAMDCVQQKQLMGNFLSPGSMNEGESLADMLIRFDRSPRRACSQLIGELENAERKIAQRESEIDELIITQCDSMNAFSSSQRAELADWLRLETEGYRPDTIHAEGGTMQPTEIVDRILLMLALDAAPGRSDSATGGTWRQGAAERGTVLSQPLIEWIEGICGQPFDVCAPERLKLNAKRYLRKKVPVDWEHRISALCQQKIAR